MILIKVILIENQINHIKIKIVKSMLSLIKYQLILMKTNSITPKFILKINNLK
jgi:hypothetical protein